MKCYEKVCMAAAMCVVSLMFALSGAVVLRADARARIASAPAGVIVTSTGLEYDEVQLPPGGTLIGDVKALDQTVLDVDDEYYSRYAQPDPFVIAEQGVRFHNVKLGDPKAIVKAKLGSAFEEITPPYPVNGVEIYNDALDATHLLWIQYAADDTVLFMVYQAYPTLAVG